MGARDYDGGYGMRATRYPGADRPSGVVHVSSSLRVLTVAYDSGRREARMGRGPAALAPAVARGRSAEVVEAGDGFATEVAVAFALAAAGRPRAGRGRGRFVPVGPVGQLPAG